MYIFIAFIDFSVNFPKFTDNILIKEMPSSSSNDNELTANGHQSQQLSISKSTITITPHAEDNGVSYTCEAVHTALLAPMRHSLTLSVLYPPGMYSVIQMRKKIYLHKFQLDFFREIN